MTKIKIHDAEWFKENCCPGKGASKEYRRLRPKGAQWKKLDKTENMVYWLGDCGMHNLAGKELEVEFTDKREVASYISSAKYVADDYWIPNWAIEWVKEVEDDE